ncbi:MAG: methyl-accepting chemotaxis protein, partial [Massilia sp.]
MLKDLSIKTKLTCGLGAIVAIILFLLALAYNNFSKLSDANQLDRHTLEVLLESQQVTGSVLQIQATARGFVMSGQEDLLSEIPDEEKAARLHISRTLKLTVDNPSQQQRLQRLGTMFERWLDTVVHLQIEKRRTQDRARAKAEAVIFADGVLEGTRTVAAIRTLIDEIDAEETRLLALRQQQSQSLQKSMTLLLGVGGLVCVLLAILIAIGLSRVLLAPLNLLTTAVSQLAAGAQGARAQVLSNDELGKVTVEFNRMAQAIEDGQARDAAATRDLRGKVDSLLEVVSKAASGDLTGTVTIGGSDAIGRLGDGLKTMFDNLRRLLNNVQKAGIQVTTSATEIAASAKQQEATGIEQAQTSVEILSTTKEISANTAQLLRTMEDATAVADYTTNATSDAQRNLTRMDLTMQQMVAATDSINAKLAALSEKASNINGVLTTITKVADQTNILSLNAAIEAEKAGDAGRGFSVVATEIRRLADQTSVSTWDIEQMLKEMQSAVSASVMGMDKFSEEIRRSVGEVRQVAEQLSSVMDQVQKLTPQFDAVLRGMQSQAVGAQQISETMMQLNDATQQTVDSLKATSEA